MEWREKLCGKPCVGILMLFDVFGIVENSQLESCLANKACVFFFFFIFGSVKCVLLCAKNKVAISTLEFEGF